MEGGTDGRTIIEMLAGAGVRHVYGVAGDSLDGITDAIYDRTDILWIPMRHEEGAGVRGYSARSDTRGSTLAARRAGRYDASKADAISNPPAIA